MRMFHTFILLILTMIIEICFTQDADPANNSTKTGEEIVGSTNLTSSSLIITEKIVGSTNLTSSPPIITTKVTDNIEIDSNKSVLNTKQNHETNKTQIESDPLTREIEIIDDLIEEISSTDDKGLTPMPFLVNHKHNKIEERTDLNNTIETIAKNDTKDHEGQQDDFETMASNHIYDDDQDDTKNKQHINVEQAVVKPKENFWPDHKIINPLMKILESKLNVINTIKDQAQYAGIHVRPDNIQNLTSLLLEQAINSLKSNGFVKR